MEKSVFVRMVTAFAAVLACCALLFCGFTTSAEATGETGWVEVQITVPEDFKDNIIVTFVNRDTFEEYSTRVLAANNYVSSFQLPLGRYKFDGAFLENSDFRYNTVLTNSTANFTIIADAEKAVLLTLKTTYNDDYSDGAQASSPAGLDASEPTDADVADPTDGDVSAVPVATTAVSDLTSEESSAPAEETQAKEEHKGSFLIDPEEGSSLSLVERLVYSLIGTVAFVLIVALFVYLYRKHIEEN